MEIEKAVRDLQDVFQKASLDMWPAVDCRWGLIGLLTVATQIDSGEPGLSQSGTGGQPAADPAW